MAYDAVVFGELAVPEQNVDAWLSGEVSAAEFTGWPDDFFDWSYGGRTPDAMLEELRALTLPAHEFVDLELNGGVLRVRGLVSRDTLTEIADPLACLFRSGALHQGLGQLTLSGHRTTAFGYRVFAAYGGSRVQVLSTDEVGAIERSQVARELDARAAKVFAQLLGGTVKKKNPSARTKEPNPFTGSMR
jgi:hypothetical protein